MTLIPFDPHEDIVAIAQRLEPHANELSGTRFLISGGSGFLGRYFTSTLSYMNREIFDKPCEIVLLDNLITGEDSSTAREDKMITVVNHDVVKPIKLDGRFDFVIQAAGIASPYYYRKYPLETLEVATIGTKNLLEIAKRDQARLLFFSSSEIYGDPDSNYVPTPESYPGNVSCLGPRACYDESKRLGETLCRIYHEQYGVRSRMVRPFNVYGPGMRKIDYRVLPNFAGHIVAGEPVNVYGSGNQTRTYCYISDAMVGFMKVLLDGVHGDPYNIGNPTPEISVLELVKEIETALGKRVDVNQMNYPDTYPADEPNRRCPDITKASRQLGYEPQVPLQEGLKRFFSWAHANY